MPSFPFLSLPTTWQAGLGKESKAFKHAFSPLSPSRVTYLGEETWEQRKISFVLHLPGKVGAAVKDKISPAIQLAALGGGPQKSRHPLPLTWKLTSLDGVGISVQNFAIRFAFY